MGDVISFEQFQAAVADRTLTGRIEAILDKGTMCSRIQAALDNEAVTTVIRGDYEPVPHISQEAMQAIRNRHSESFNSPD